MLHYENSCKMHESLLEIFIPNKKVSKLLLGTYSYTSSFSSSSKHTPWSLTRFLCWSLATSTSSFLSSSIPCLEFVESLFTAISCPSGSIPFKNMMRIKTKPKNLTWKKHVSMLSDNQYCPVKRYLINWTKTTLSKLIDFRKISCSRLDNR